MDIDLSMISAVVNGGSLVFSNMKKRGINKKTFMGDRYRAAWDYIENHVVEHGVTPSVDLFEAKAGFSLDAVKDTAEAIAEELRKRSLWRTLTSKHEDIGQLLEKREPDEALKLWDDASLQAKKQAATDSPVESLLSIGNDVVEYYNKLKRGERGVLTPWESLNDATLGFWPGDFIVLAARMGVGKTFAMLLLARHAWLNGKKVLFVGTEMARLKLAIRFYAIHLKLPYRDFRRGTLGIHQEENLLKGIEQTINLEGLTVVGDNFNARMDEIENAVALVDPDILFVDGIYLVRNRGKDRHTMVSNTADDLKRLARLKGIPIVGSHQFNRTAGANDKDSISAENLGITDVIGWNADCMYGLWQTDDMRDDATMGFKPLKLREGEGKEFYSHWDFKSMFFDELEKKSSSYKDDDFGSFGDDGENDDYDGGDYSDDGDGILF